jgi:TonB family protein
MKVLLPILLLFFQASQPFDKWECCGDSEPLSGKQLARVKPNELKGRVVSCALPRLPGVFDGQGTIAVEIQIDEEGNVRCAKALTGHPVMKRAAVEAAKQWKFKPLIVEGKASPFQSVLLIVVHWDAREAEKQCSKEKQA